MDNYLKLYNGSKIPVIGFGTGVIRRYSQNKRMYTKKYIRCLLSSVVHRRINRELYGDIFIKKIIKNAYESGFQFFDTGRLYGWSEYFIGKVLKETNNRNNIFIVTKFSPLDLKRMKNLDNVKELLDFSLKQLDMNYVDAYLMHCNFEEAIDCYEQMEQVYLEGKTKAIGVCNFSVKDLDYLNARVKIKPMIMQTELHPLNTCKDMREYCKIHNIQIMAHTPTARMCSKIKESEILNELARKYNKTLIQIILRWHIQNHIIPICSTFNKNHMKENMNIFDFTMSEEEIGAIEEMNEDLILLPKAGQGTDPNFVYNV